MTESAPHIDYANLPAPTEGFVVTLFITVRNVARSRDFYSRVFLNLRVADVQASYEEWKAKGAEFVTPPIDRGAEIRCYLRDPDGYLIEVGQSTGLLHGKLAAKRPDDLPG